MYGAAFAVVSTVAGVMQVLGQGYVKTPVEGFGAVLLLALVGLIAIVVARHWIDRRWERHDRTTA